MALEGKPGQRHRQSASLTKGRGGIGGVGRGSWKVAVTECSTCDRVVRAHSARLIEAKELMSTKCT